MDELKKTFDELYAVNCSDHMEQKKQGSTTLNYLSWTYAWAEVKKRYPEAQYTIWRNSNGLPYAYDALTGYMVYTTVTIGGISHEMWLPVMDGANKAMKAEPYTYDTKYNGKKTVDAATMFDINKTIMRCLVKNLAMFGLGLYIYAGEDLPIVDDDTTEKEEKTEKVTECACERCGKKISAYKNDGKVVPLEKHISGSREKFGGVFCLDCIRKVTDESA